MATIKRFEDLEIWQLARQLENCIYEETGKGKLSKDYKLKDQMNSCTGSSERFKELYELTDLVCKKINAFMSYLNKSAIKGQKFANRLITK
jgi:hypothetical protein